MTKITFINLITPGLFLTNPTKSNSKQFARKKFPFTFKSFMSKFPSINLKQKINNYKKKV